MVNTDNSSRTNGESRLSHILALLTFLATLILIALGGLVTSHNAGLAVPDWPNTFGYNPFLFPVDRWVGGIWFEHTHRLWASVVGFLTIGLAVILQWKERRGWLKTLGWIVLALVIAQAVLGGLRVTMLKAELGIFHACLAQTFFVLVGLITLFTSRWWRDGADSVPARLVAPRWRWAVIAVTGLIYVQLILGATMRHAHLGLSIPDYPLAYGQLIPPLDAATVERINEHRLSAGMEPTTAVQIALQFTHRLVAVAVLFGIVLCVDALRRQERAPRILRRAGMTWVGLVGLQFVLGASTVWSNKAADVATTHVVVGALTLFVGALLAAIAWRIESNPVLVDDNLSVERKQSGRYTA